MVDRPPLPSPFNDWPRPFAFALSGGGAFGPVQIGMLRALADRGITPDLIVGTSVGALHGAAIAADGYATLDRLEREWQTLDRARLFGGRRTLVSSVIRHRSLSTPSRLAAMIDEFVSDQRFDDLRTPFAAVATDAFTGDPQLLSTGKLVPALVASCAVPGVFPRVELGGRTYVDGGVSANVPIRQAISFGAASVLSLDATPPIVASQLPSSFIGTVLHSASLMLRSQRSSAVDDIAHRYRVAVLPSATPPDMGSFNFSHTAELIEQSHRLAADALDQWTSSSIITDLH